MRKIRGTAGTFTVTNEGCQPHLFDQVVVALREWGWLVPPWVAFVRLTFDSDDSGTLRMRVAEEYRTVYIGVCNGWAKVREDERGRWVMHELVHIHQNHVFHVLSDLLDATTEDGSALRTWAEREAVKAVERGTNDLERIIWTRLGRDRSPLSFSDMPEKSEGD